MVCGFNCVISASSFIVMGFTVFSHTKYNIEAAMPVGFGPVSGMRLIILIAFREKDSGMVAFDATYLTFLSAVSRGRAMPCSLQI